MKTLLFAGLALAVMLSLSLVGAGLPEAVAWVEGPTMVASPAQDTFDGVVTEADGPLNLLQAVVNPASAASLLFLLGTVANAPKKRPTMKPEGPYTGDIKIEQKSDLSLPPLGEDIPRGERIQPVSLKDLTKDYLDELAFNEEPVTIIIPLSSEKDVARCTDLIEINGVKAEILFKNGWVQFGWFPKGYSFTTKRKYVEVLARSKMDNVTTLVTEPTDGGDPSNVVQRFTTAKTGFQVIADKNPRGAEWLRRIVSSQA